MIDQSLQLRLAQKLAMAPQLQQAIRLLQLNRLELREYIQEAVESNPLLETETPEQEAESEPQAAPEPEGNTDAPDDYNEFGAESWSEDQPGAEYWQENSGFSEAFSDAQIPDESGNSLREHLLWQINLSHFSPTDEDIATAIVFALDDDGFLHDSIEDIRTSLAPEILVENDEILAVLHRIQRMEPVGVASRDPGECIGVQLSALPADTSGRDLARRLVRDFLDLVANHQVGELARETSAPVESLEKALELIRSLEPRPGARFDNRRDEYLAPDIYVRKLEGEWVVTLSPDNDPGLRLNKYYVSLLRQSGKKDADYLRGRLQEARWLLSSLELRNRTLVKVARCIVERQEGFMEEGDIAMKPMILKEVAELVGVHESTVSRATTRKYMLTPRGLYELKHFFSSHVKSRTGGLVSATAIKARLQILFENEPLSKPLSDQEISQLLLDAGICVARRIVAKYRESLGIGSSSELRRAYRRMAARQAARAD
jgi:RNA polymerase sigma-54 factor